MHEAQHSTTEALDAAALEGNHRGQVRTALLAAGIEPEVLTGYELTQGGLSERAFFKAALDAEVRETRRAMWPSEDSMADHGEVLFREDHGGVFKLDDGSIVYASIRNGWFVMQVATQTEKQAVDVVAAFSNAYPPLYRDSGADDGKVPITFWTNGKFGPTSRLRMIDAAEWSGIEGNYTAGVRDELARLATDFEPGKDGQLILWQGSPGTGKTWALRALASEWRDWAEFQYITDPDAFFVSDPSYMIDVLLHESYEELTAENEVVTEASRNGKWRVLILEDTGELLAANAKESYGQGLSRLLNVVDGMVGQGLRVLAIVTTNDELDALHPAVTRPGRCASQVVFGPLTAEEASAWLGEAVENEATLAELYELAGKSQPAFTADEEEETMAMEGTCTCGHDAEMHAGADYSGACSAEGCDCEAFVAKGAAADEKDSETASGTLNLPLGTTGNTVTTPNSLNFNLTDLEVLPPVDPETEIVPASSKGGLRWVATLAPEGKATADGRIFAPGAITWRELPLSLMGMVETQEGHDGAQVCGRIDTVWREEATGLIRGSGEFDTGEFGSDIARLVGDQTLRGVSVDIAVSEVEIAYRSEVVDEEGNWIEKEPVDGEESGGPSLVDVIYGEEEPVIFVVRAGVIGAATVCPFPAFAEANIELESSLVAGGVPMLWTVTSQAGWVLTPKRVVEEAAPESADVEVLTASAAGIAPDAPPAEWFSDPELEELTPLTVDDDGRIYGHAAPWGECHIGIPGVCTTAPESETNYAYFLLKEVVADDGSRIAVGTITLDAPHAERGLGRSDAAAHYDHTGVAVADVVAGQDDHGIWVAGALRGDVSEDQARKLRGAALSGDWRDVNGNLELVALLAVNVPGFPIPRTQAALVASGEGVRVLTLIAASDHKQGDGGMTRPELAQLEVLRDIADGTYAELEAEAGS